MNPLSKDEALWLAKLTEQYPADVDGWGFGPLADVQDGRALCFDYIPRIVYTYGHPIQKLTAYRKESGNNFYHESRYDPCNLLRNRKSMEAATGTHSAYYIDDDENNFDLIVRRDPKELSRRLREYAEKMAS